MTLYLRSSYIRANVLSVLRLHSTVATEIESNEQVVIDDTEDVQAREKEMQKKRNISRLSSSHYNMVNGRRPYEVAKSLAHLTVKYNRKMYGKYGIASGVNPSICWPSRRDVQERKAYESVAFPFTIQDMITAAAQKKEAKQMKIEQREMEVVAKFEKLDQWKKDLKEKIAKKEAEILASKIKKERLVEEVRRHFGFKVDPRDERFQELLAKKEKEQKKKEKQARMEAKEKVMIAKLQQKNVAISSKS